MAPPINSLFKYFYEKGRANDMEKEYYEALPWRDETCLVVLNYVMKFLSNYDNTLLSDIITRLDDLAEDHLSLQKNMWKVKIGKINRKNQEMSEMFVDCLMPEVRRFFNVPKLNQLSENDKSLLKENEIMAGFMDFLMQILDSEALVVDEEQGRYSLLQRELRYVLTFLGDVPFQCTTTQLQLFNKNILAQFQTVANEAGTLIYDWFFAPVKVTRFYGASNSLLENVRVLNENIKEHCIKFSEIIPRCIITTTTTTPKGNIAIDSLFIVDSLLEDLDNVISGLFNFLCIDNDIKDHIKIIRKEMTYAQTFLKEVDLALLQDPFKNELIEASFQIRDVAYEAEYLVNSYVVGNLPIWYLNLRLPTIIQSIKLIGIRCQELKKMYDIKVLKVERDFINRKLSLQLMETRVDVDDSIVVGFEDERTKILDDLTGGSKSQQIIYIFGLPGLGKTTIAKKLYNDRASFDYFDERAWSVVSQTYQKKNVLIDIFMSLAASKLERQDKENILKMEDESLGLEIHKKLKGQRYFIVMDDVWDSNMWYDLRRYFPDDVNGSRIIFTTRVRDTAPTGSIFHPLPLLSDVQCWDLLEKKVFSREPCPSELLCTGKGIAAKCHGLPLAVVVIAGILAKLEKEENMWKRVERNLDSYLFDDPSGCSKILELSYEYLPNHLKLCFLYFGVFPEDADVQTQKLIRLWIAEGFIPKQEEKNPETVAKECLFDLINRSLLMVVKRRFDGEVKSCSIHDLLHDMCLRKVHGENFLKSIKEEFSIYEKHQRLCYQSTPNTSSSFALGYRHTPNSSGSFGLYCRSLFGNLSDPSPCLSHMALLRVMDRWLASSACFELKGNYPVNLRYLSAYDMPLPTVNKLANLEVLCVKYYGELKLSFILQNAKLRHLHSQRLKIVKDCHSHQTTILHSLGYVYIENKDDEEILRRSPYLCKFKCACERRLFPDLHSLTQLESLTMFFYEYYEGKLTKISFPPTIKKVTLSGIGLPSEAMSIIGRLPNLQYLRLGHLAFIGKEWVIEDGEFQELRFLTLVSANNLEQWISCNEHFPKLVRLEVKGCYKLQEIPSDLGNISTLEMIEVSDCSYEASISAVRIEKEQHESYGNEELKVIINNSEWSKEQLMRESELVS